MNIYDDMSKIVLLSLSVALIAAGCTKIENKPPKYDDVDNIIIDNEKITAREYFDRFCSKEQRMEYDDPRRCEVVMNKVASDARSVNNPNSSIYGQEMPDKF